MDDSFDNSTDEEAPKSISEETNGSNDEKSMSSGDGKTMSHHSDSSFEGMEKEKVQQTLFKISAKLIMKKMLCWDDMIVSIVSAMLKDEQQKAEILKLLNQLILRLDISKINISNPSQNMSADIGRTIASAIVSLFDEFQNDKNKEWFNADKLEHISEFEIERIVQNWDLSNSLNEFNTLVTEIENEPKYYCHTGINVYKKILYTTLTTIWLLLFLCCFVTVGPSLNQVLHLIIMVALVTILLFTIDPLTIDLKVRKCKCALPLNMVTVSISVICILLLTFQFRIHSALAAIVGTDTNIIPWRVLGILFGLFYLSITLEKTGLISALSIAILRQSKGSIFRLYVLIFVSCAVLTLLTNNDISIICLTPFAISISKQLKIDSEPFVFLVLFASNIWSMLLPFDNPANLIIAQIAHLTFIVYVKWMLLPTLLSVGFLFLALLLTFGSQLKMVSDRHVGSHGFQIDESLCTFEIKKNYAIFCLVRLLCGVVGLVLSSFFEIAFLDILVVASIAIAAFFCDLTMNVIDNYKPDRDARTRVGNSEEYTPLLPFIDDSESQKLSLRSSNGSEANIINFSAVEAVTEIPWNLLAFVFALFILVQFMFDVGFVAMLASYIEAQLTVQYNNIFLPLIIAFCACFGCTVLNNLPLTALVATVLSNIDTSDAYEDSYVGAVLGLSIGVNIGANSSPIASLAVLIWQQILIQHGCRINYFRFLKRSLMITPVIVAVAVGSLLLALWCLIV